MFLKMKGKMLRNAKLKAISIPVIIDCDMISYFLHNLYSEFIGCILGRQWRRRVKYHHQKKL